MAFDMGFNFRGTSGYVTDPAYAVPVLGEAYPHTYTNANGFSLNAGFTQARATPTDRVNTNDPRIAGVNYAAIAPGSDYEQFQIDLSSGSAPGAGTYTVDIAIGDAGSSQHCPFFVKDNTTTFLTYDVTPATGHFYDATITDVTASATWTGTTISQAIASTTVNVFYGPHASSGGFPTLAHFRLALATVAAPIRRSPLMPPMRAA